MKLRVGIAGGAGYTGGELIRLLLNHPQVEMAFVQSKSQAGKALSEVHSGLSGETEMRFSAAAEEDAELLFICAGHGEARRYLDSHALSPATRIIDLSQDFRLSGQAQHGDRHFIYGLPELNRVALQHAQNVANPGCFATAIQLALLPLVKAGFKGPVHTTGITGATGAGQAFSATSHFSWRHANVQAYKSLDHQHLHEIRQSLAQAAPGGAAPALYFVPWRGDFTRGIYCSSVLDFGQSLEDAQKLFRDFYADAAFTHFSDRPIDLKQVVNTNKCLISLEGSDGKLVVHSAIDNLLKGASGQAVQNMNLMFGFDEREGLRLKASAF